MSVVSTDNGIATSEMNVVCQLSRNTNSTIATQTSASAEHAQHVVDRHLDEGRLPELHVGDAHAFRHHLLQLRQHGLDLARDRDGIGVGLLLHGEDDGRACR